MATQVQFRGGTTTEHSSFNGAAREVTVDTTKQTLVVQDGSTNGGFPLLREKNADNVKVHFGGNGTTDAGYLQIYSDGTNNQILSSNGDIVNTVDTGHWFYIKTDAGNDVSLIAKPNAGVTLYWDNSPTFQTTSYGAETIGTFRCDALSLLNNEQIQLGSNGTELQIYHDGSNNNLKSTAGHINVFLPTGRSFSVGNSDFSEDIFKATEGGAVELYNASNVRLATTSTGVDVTGNLTTGQEVTISGADPRLKFVDTDNNPDFTIWSNAQKFAIYDEAASASRVHINSSGSVGFGTDDPDRAVHIEGTNPFLRLTDSATAPGNGEINGMIEFETRDASAPGVANNIRSELVSNSTGASSLYFSAGTPSTIGTKMEIQHGGDVKINNGNLIIGTGGKGIDFSAQTWTATGNTINNDDGSPEVLDHYEEGTWTPTDASGAGMTFSVTSAVFTRIGRMVFARAHSIVFPTTNNTTGAHIGGLPFTCSSAHGSGGRPVTSDTDGTAFLVDNESSKFWIYGAATTSGSTYAQLSGAVIYGLCLIYEVSI